MNHVSISPTTTVSMLPGATYLLHAGADKVKPKIVKRLLLLSTAGTRPIDGVVKTVLLVPAIPLAHCDALYCNYKNKQWGKLAARAAIGTPWLILRIPIETGLYGIGVGISSVTFNPLRAILGAAKPEKKIESYFLVRQIVITEKSEKKTFKLFRKNRSLSENFDHIYETYYPNLKQCNETTKGMSKMEILQLSLTQDYDWDNKQATKESRKLSVYSW